MKNNKVIILAYFGKLPNYFPLFIDSCERNMDFDFIYFTDQKTTINPNSNIRVVRMKFEDLKNLVNQRIGKEYMLHSPYKLCDYKPAYGKIFGEYISDYRFWGYCDADMILGGISNFISNNDFRDYDKLLIDGHLGFYRNTKKVNEYFLLESNKCINFKIAAKYKEPCFFDEIVMPKILSNHSIKQYTNYSYADILPQHKELTVSKNSSIGNHYDQKFFYENGKVYQEYTENGLVITKELMYIHLQKRTMSIDDKININLRIYIQSNLFSNSPDLNNTEDAFVYRIKYEIKRFRNLKFNKILIKLKNRIIK